MDGWKTMEDFFRTGHPYDILLSCNLGTQLLRDPTLVKWGGFHQPTNPLRVFGGSQIGWVSSLEMVVVGSEQNPSDL